MTRREHNRIAAAEIAAAFRAAQQDARPVEPDTPLTRALEKIEWMQRAERTRKANEENARAARRANWATAFAVALMFAAMSVFDGGIR